MEWSGSVVNTGGLEIPEPCYTDSNPSIGGSNNSEGFTFLKNLWHLNWWNSLSGYFFWVDALPAFLRRTPVLKNTTQKVIILKFMLKNWHLFSGNDYTPGSTNIAALENGPELKMCFLLNIVIRIQTLNGIESVVKLTKLPGIRESFPWKLKLRNRLEHGFILLMAEILHHLGCMKPYK